MTTKKHWRMTFRIGTNGNEMWPCCCNKGIAAITYWPTEIQLGDLSNVSIEEYENKWRQSGSTNTTGRASLRKFRYDMKKGDIIYVKEGPHIVGRGTVKSRYKHDKKILKGCKQGLDFEKEHKRYGVAWGEHYRGVDWDKDFPRFRLVLGADTHTVLELTGERLKKLHEKERQEIMHVEAIEAAEGKKYTSESTFRARNRALVEAKKAGSDYCCEVCEMNFEKVYGRIGAGHIIAHHLKPIGARNRSSRTMLDDIALVCSNCHDMLHRKDPPLNISELRSKLRRGNNNCCV